MSGFGAIFVFIGVMPVLTNIIVTRTASSNLLSPGVPRLFVSDLCRAPISGSGLWPQIYQWNQCKITDAEWCDAWFVQRIISVRYRGLMHIRPVRSGCHEHDRLRQKSNVPTSVFTFLMFHDDALQISTFSRHCVQKRNAYSQFTSGRGRQNDWLSLCCQPFWPCFKVVTLWKDVLTWLGSWVVPVCLA